MRSPDVALITPYPGPGDAHGGRSGVASYSAQLARALSERGAQVTVLAPQEPGVPTVHADGGVRVERRYRRGAAALPAAARAARASGAASVHVQHELFLYGGPESVPGLVPALRGMRAAGQGPVVTLHHVVDPASVDRSFARMHRVRAPAGLARAGLHAVQSAVRRFASRVLVHEPAFAEIVPGADVVPHGVPVPKPLSRADARRALGLSEHAFVALCFGFLAPYKGLEPALEGAARAGVQTYVVGREHPRLAESGDDYAARLERRFGHSARFTGAAPDEDVPNWFRAADVALLLYPRPFSASGALALALAHGTPVLVSPALARSAGLPDELAVRPQPGLIAARLRALGSDPALADRLASLSRGIARPRLWPAVAERHLEIYREAAA